MFKFNFADTNNEEPKKDISPETTLETALWLKSEPIHQPTENDIIMNDIFTNCEENILDCKGLSLKYFSTLDVLNILRTSDDCHSTKNLSVLNADQSHSDLQTAVYEGGLKIWECTYDLINYISESNLNFDNKKVLDLGCGAGLIGLLCLIKGALCTFQDYNAEVLQYITIPNIRLNEEAYLAKSKFYSGDWGSFVDVIGIENDEDKFDYIFTSETIYNIENYEKLHKTFQRLLKKNGTIFLAAKSYYFGVGGGISAFEEYLKNKGIFKSLSCSKCSDGLKREILEITFIQ